MAFPPAHACPPLVRALRIGDKMDAEYSRRRCLRPDASHDALESMDKGELNNTVFQDPVGQGEEGVNATYLLVKKQPNSKVVYGIIWIPYQPVNKENYKSFMK